MEEKDDWTCEREGDGHPFTKLDPQDEFIPPITLVLNYKDQLESFILRGMKKYKIKSVLVTLIDMLRTNLITKEVMESFCNGGDSWLKRHNSSWYTTS